MYPGIARKTTAAGMMRTRAKGMTSPAPGSNPVAPLWRDLKTLDAPAAFLTAFNRQNSRSRRPNQDKYRSMMGRTRLDQDEHQRSPRRNEDGRGRRGNNRDIAFEGSLSSHGRTGEGRRRHSEGRDRHH